MQQQPKFVDNLIALRDHYRTLLEEYERLCAHVRAQLTHVNALLVDQLVENQHFVQSLIGLRNHYQALNEEYQRNASNAKEQLTHVNALLVDQLVLQHSGQQPVSIEALTVNQNQTPALTEAADIKSEKSPKEPLEVGEQDEPEESNQPTTPAPATQVLQDSLAVSASPEQTEALPEKPSFPTPSEVANSEPIALDTGSSTSHNNGFNNINKKQAVSSHRRLASKTGNTKLDVLPQYRSLPKEKAVMQLLQSNAGTILHIDYIVRTLYGDLNKSAFKLAKDRIANTLYRGQQKKLWAKVPQQPGCFTLDLKLADSDNSEASS